MQRIGMIGLGAMGRNVALNIMKAGYELSVFDVVPAAIAALAQQGAKGTESIEEMGKTCDTVLVMVNNYAQAADVFQKLFTGMKSGVVICLSTIAVADAEKLDRMAEEAGVTYIDCPVSGGTRGAQAGKLTLMVSGPRAVYDELMPLFKAFGENVVFVDEKAGRSQALKSINQLLVGVHMCATAEAFTLAKACGLDLQLVYDVISKSAGNSNIFSNRGQFAIERNFDTRSTIAIQVKDTKIVCDTAKELGVPVYLADKALELFKEAYEKYTPTDDSLEVMRVYEEHCEKTE